MEIRGLARTPITALATFDEDHSMTTVATPRRSCFPLIWPDYLFFLWAIGASLLTIYAVSADYRAGSHNQSGVAGYAGVLPGVGNCAGYLALVVYGIMVLVKKHASLGKWLLYLFVGLLPFAASLGTKANLPGGHGFGAGFNHWITQHVNPAPIQSWIATQAAPTGPRMVPPDEWPAAIRELHPERVDLWKDRGITLTWGRVAHDGDRRQVFIGRQQDSPPPPEVLWTEIGAPGDGDVWTPINEDGWPATWQHSKPGVWSWNNIPML